MNHEAEFKKSLNDLVDSKQFTFEEQDWEKARALIDSKRRRRVPVLWAALLVGVAGLTTFVLMQPPQANAVADVTTPATMQQKQPAAIATTPAPVAPIQTDKSTPSGNAAKPIASHKQPAPGTQAPPAAEPVTDKSITPQNQPVVKTPPVKTEPAVKPSETEAVKEVAVPVAATAIVHAKTDEPVTPEPNAPTAPQAESAMPGEGLRTDSPVPTVTAVVPAAAVAQQNTPGNTTQNNADPVTTPVTATAEPVATADQAVADATVAATEATLAATTVAAPDTGATALSPAKQKVTLLSIEGGITYLNGWNNNGTIDARSLNPVAGLNYHHRLSNNIEVMVGLQYNAIGNLSAYSYSATTTRYTTGEEIQVWVFTPKKMHYLVAPIRFNYLLTRHDAVGAGLNVAYLMDVVSTQETYEIVRNSKQNATTTTVHGYSQGFSTLDPQVALFYRRELFKGFYAHCEAFVGLTDVKDNTFFKSDATERNLGVKLTLLYSLINR